MKLSFNMIILLTVIASIFMGCSGTRNDLRVRLGQEASLIIGQRVLVVGEDLSIEFTDVVEDSRCPRNVTCVWQGQAVCAIRITLGKSVNDLSLIEPGLTDDYTGVMFGDYIISFKLNPYPENTAGIAKEDYILTLVCDLVNYPIETEADVTGFITDIQIIGEKDMIGRVLIESHADKIVDKYNITINTQTRIFRQAGDELIDTTFQRLENKQWVKLWFAGPVMESFPMQATARQIVIIE
jgi:hypothetical protein